MIAAPPADCASCPDERAAGASFCEECGRALTTGSGTPAAPPPASGPAPAPPCGTAPSLGSAALDCPACATADAIGTDGYCTHCGILAARPRDHQEIEMDGGAAVSDRGRRHHRNEDAVWLSGAGCAVVVVVCDGVSSSFDPDVASADAAQTAGRLLAGSGVEAGPGVEAGSGVEAGTGVEAGPGTGVEAEPRARIRAAIVAAGAAVAALVAGDPRRAVSNPSCTIVAARVRAGTITYGWVGDSRAYWIPSEGAAVQLTEDDSWAADAIGHGMDPRQAWSEPRAHAITAWLGADAGEIKPRTGQFVPSEAGHLLLCSDGLWNYLTEHGTLADTVRAHLRAASGGPAPLLVAARTLTAFANEAGGIDNITVALAPVAPATDAIRTAQ